MQENPQLIREKSSRLKFVSVITGAGLMAALAVAGLAGVASAQTVISDDVGSQMHVVSEAVPMSDSDSRTGVFMTSASAVQIDEDGLDGFNLELSAEDEALFEQFDQCLSDAGIDFEDDGASTAELDEATLDAAFDQCDPILDGLSDDFGDFENMVEMVEPLEISPEDDAVFERFDQCLSDAGLDLGFEEPADGLVEDGAVEDGVAVEGAADEAEWDAAFEQCDPILDDLSGDFDVFGGFGDMAELSPEDEATFDAYDECLNAGGADALFESEQFDEAAINALFETCDPILDGLSEEAQAMFGDCPEDDDHSAAVEAEAVELNDLGA